ncbi:zinc ribbon domain-containing protein [Paenibacillus sp. N1-5-1-14]|uniref:zinc ribbon domain-containing protein n=1 Tax=Paenibacillus radicibacter TaxID=2972488 RepID=UPI002158D9C5|nr:zinc ribbon domain-containing protein [Paenibacillus radicibacter]MCR8643497.1 zinc ribbon domain-containing protein [Paenibacillus radicibacter]
MNSFFDKIKQGANIVSDKAQVTIELTKISTQISSKNKEVDKLLLQIGSEAHQAFRANNLLSAEPRIEEISKQIAVIQRDIDILEVKAKELKNEKECVCGKIVALDTRFCPVCGNKFDPQVTVVDAIPSGTQTVDLDK